MTLGAAQPRSVGRAVEMFLSHHVIFITKKFFPLKVEEPFSIKASHLDNRSFSQVGSFLW